MNRPTDLKEFIDSDRESATLVPGQTRAKMKSTGGYDLIVGSNKIDRLESSKGLPDIIVGKQYNFKRNRTYRGEVLPRNSVLSVEELRPPDEANEGKIVLVSLMIGKQIHRFWLHPDSLAPFEHNPTDHIERITDAIRAQMPPEEKR
ncbi:hypothetical protein KA119_02305 [Candidatus Gracilibacteria bacterium]|nr:hypothetical protein [Candidatus Gracilibacteria bacterium]